MIKKYFVKKISLNIGHDCNKDAFAAKKENYYGLIYYA